MHKQLTEALVLALENAVKDAITQLPGEKIYSIAIYTCGEYLYAMDSIMTQEGLEAVAADYLKKPFFQARWKSLANACAALQWSPTDSPYHGAFDKHFDVAQEILDAIWEENNKSDDPHAAEHIQKVRQAMLDALLRFKASDAAPDGNIVYNLLMGDQSDEERFLNAQQLNSPDGLAVVKADLLKACDAFERQYTLNSNTYKTTSGTTINSY